MRFYGFDCLRKAGFVHGHFLLLGKIRVSAGTAIEMPDVLVVHAIDVELLRRIGQR